MTDSDFMNAILMTTHVPPDFPVSTGVWRTSPIAARTFYLAAQSLAINYRYSIWMGTA